MVRLFVTSLDYIFWGIALFWFLGLTIAGIWLYRFLTRLTKGVKEKELVKILDKILSDQGRNAQSVEEVQRQIEEIRKDNAFHIQKVGLIRFNPFSEVGGDHSFSLALLDANNTGIVATSIHTRDRTRVYAKVIKRGKSEIDLSSEEKKALAEAQKR